MLSETVPGSGPVVPYGRRPQTVFQNVTFPIPTYYCPPQPPSQLMGRYRPPPRPGPRFLNDLALAGPREHEAQKEVSRMWRGIMERRRLRNARTFHHVRTRRAIMIQCWWRRLSAIWRLRKLKKIIEEWAVERREEYVSNRLKGYGVMMTWQRVRFENAVILVQRVYRWYVNRLQRMHADACGSDVPKALPFPLAQKKKRYFPWRPQAPAPVSMAASSAPKSRQGTGKDKQSTPSRARLSIHSCAESRIPVPPSQEELEAINVRMREREAQIAESLAQPEVRDRQQWKRDGLREKDFEHNAGMIQRLVRYKWASLNKMTLGVTAEYFYKKVSIIQRAFRIGQTWRNIERRRHGLEKRARLKNEAYAKTKLEEIEEGMVWQAQLYNDAALTIQKMYAYYKSRRVYKDPFKHSESDVYSIPVELENPPPPPPYHHLDKHIAREHALRNAARSKMEREMEEAQKNTRRSRVSFTPTKIIVVSADPPVENITLPVPTKNVEEPRKRSLPFSTCSDNVSSKGKGSEAVGEPKRLRSIVLIAPGESNTTKTPVPRLSISTVDSRTNEL